MRKGCLEESKHQLGYFEVSQSVEAQRWQDGVLGKLFDAVSQNDLKRADMTMAELLVDIKDVNALVFYQEHKLNALIHLAAGNTADNGDMLIDYLEKQDADLQLENVLGWTALTYAVRANNTKIVEFLMSRGVNNMPDKFGLFAVDFSRDEEMTKLLQENGYGLPGLDKDIK